jgi:eukaryotic-like serine/threonine-protein kinase
MAAQHPATARGGSDESAGETNDGLPCRFGKYTLIRRLATGGMAELFLAIQKSVAGFEKLIVIKRILPAQNKDREFIEMLLNEARVAATLSHPNVVQTFDVGQIDGTYFIAMEHVHGEDLRSIVRHMKKKDVIEFPLEHALSIVLGVCAGLAYAHDRRDLDGTPLHIVHRDISPQNIVVTFTGDVKIVDFGIAKSDAKLEEQIPGGRLKGKVPYMSPEQARGETIDWRSDIFAAGVMLFELTTGKRLFKGANEYETLKLIVDEEYPLPSQACLGYPSQLEVIVMRALAKDRAHRWQSAREMQGAIEELVRKERLPVSTIALSKFMQGLFEEKLANQKEALLQGKQLADIIAIDTGVESTGGAESHGRSMSMTTGDSTRMPAGKPQGRARGAWIGVSAAALLAAGAIVWWTRGPATPAHAPSAALAAPVPALPSPELNPVAAGSAPPPVPEETATAPVVSTTPATAAPRTATRQPALAATASATMATATGKLNVSARGGWCTLSIDGAPHGPTPVAGIVLPAGRHTVTCTPEGGPTMSASVKIDPDATARYSFTIAP